MTIQIAIDVLLHSSLCHVIPLYAITNISFDPTTLLYRFRNLDVTGYSRLGNNATTLDCLNKCRSDQECFSFNYDKTKKWCYISLSEKSDLVVARDGKFAAGYRKCVAHTGNGAWDNPGFNGGQE